MASSLGRPATSVSHASASVPQRASARQRRVSVAMAHPSAPRPLPYSRNVGSVGETVGVTTEGAGVRTCARGGRCVTWTGCGPSWRRGGATLQPGADGWLGTTAGIAADGTFIAVVRFESGEGARVNSSRPEQGEWWKATEATFDAAVTFTDCPDVDIIGEGGSADAGFVQVIFGRADRSASSPSPTSWPPLSAASVPTSSAPLPPGRRRDVHSGGVLHQ
jgi:hypothetical protein